MALLTVVGIDPSLRHWGIARGTYDTVTRELRIPAVSVVEPVLPTGKQVRQNSKDLDSARQLFKASHLAVAGAHMVFVEVPVGSQSARGMASYAICVGVLGSLRALDVPLIEVSPTEVKVIATGKKTASKDEMIAWATDKHPEANWPFYNQQGQQVLSAAKAEHMSDAIGAIYAGLATPTFQQMLHMMKAA